MSGHALIIVDMLNDFIDTKGALFAGAGARIIVPFIREKLDDHRKKGNVIVFLQDAHAQGDAEFEKFPRHCVQGTWGSEIIAELAPQTGEHVLPKTRYSGFYNTPLARILTDARINIAEVVGVCTSICVMDTVGGLANRDYMVRVPRQGVADFDPQMHEFAIRRMEKIYGAQII